MTDESSPADPVQNRGKIQPATKNSAGPGPSPPSSAPASSSPALALGAPSPLSFSGPHTPGSPIPARSLCSSRFSLASPLTLVFGIPAATIVERESGGHDPQFVVIDEVAGQWITLLLSPADWRHGLVALVLFRLFDIAKPFPVRRLERLPGGWGIVFDDVAAGLYAFVYSVNRSHLVLTMPRSLPSTRPDAGRIPRVDDVLPSAALPNGEVELIGVSLGPNGFGLPSVAVDNQPAHVLMSRPTRLVFRVPALASAGIIEVRTPAGAANPAALRVARQLNDGLHPVTSPAVSRSGMVYATISGPRGKQTPVSVVRVSPDGRATPFVTGILNATGLAFNPDGDLFVTSRAEGNVYRIDAAGESTVYVEGMGVATGAAFDAEGNLFVGDRSGTIFKINPRAPDLRPRYA